MSASPLPVVVLISGGGSNLQALIDAAARDLINIAIKAVISNQADAYGLQRASSAGIETRVLDHHDFTSREAYDRALMGLIDSVDPGLVILAGFMRILTPTLVNHYQGRMFNIHPSLLPKYRGLHTHQRALDAAETVHGASVHFVTADLDSGPLVLQAMVPVEADDDAETLAARVLVKEHIIYPKAVGWFADGRLMLGNDGVPVLDGERLTSPFFTQS